MVSVSRSQGFQGGIELVSKPGLAGEGPWVESSGLSLQDMKQMNPRADLYVRSLTRIANLRG